MDGVGIKENISASVERYAYTTIRVCNGNVVTICALIICASVTALFVPYRR